MKKKELKKKLSLNKQKVSKLEQNEMNIIKGGTVDSLPYGMCGAGPSNGCPSAMCSEYCNGTSPCTTGASDGYEDWTNWILCS